MMSGYVDIVSHLLGFLAYPIQTITKDKRNYQANYKAKRSLFRGLMTLLFGIVGAVLMLGDRYNNFFTGVGEVVAESSTATGFGYVVSILLFGAIGSVIGKVSFQQWTKNHNDGDSNSFRCVEGQQLTDIATLFHNSFQIKTIANPANKNNASTQVLQRRAVTGITTPVPKSVIHDIKFHLDTLKKHIRFAKNKIHQPGDPLFSSTDEAETHFNAERIKLKKIFSEFKRGNFIDFIDYLLLTTKKVAREKEKYAKYANLLNDMHIKLFSGTPDATSNRRIQIQTSPQPVPNTLNQTLKTSHSKPPISGKLSPPTTAHDAATVSETEPLTASEADHNAHHSIVIDAPTHVDDDEEKKRHDEQETSNESNAQPSADATQETENEADIKEMVDKSHSISLSGKTITFNPALNDVTADLVQFYDLVQFNQMFKEKKPSRRAKKHKQTHAAEPLVLSQTNLLAFVQDTQTLNQEHGNRLEELKKQLGTLTNQFLPNIKVEQKGEVQPDSALPKTPPPTLRPKIAPSTLRGRQLAQFLEKYKPKDTQGRNLTHVASKLLELEQIFQQPSDDANDNQGTETPGDTLQSRRKPSLKRGGSGDAGTINA